MMKSKSHFRALVAGLLLASGMGGCAPPAFAAGPSGIVDKMYVAKGAGAVPRTFADKAGDVVSATDYGAKDAPLADDSAAEASALSQATATRSMLRTQWMYKMPKRGVKAWKSTFGSRDQAAVASFTDGDDTTEPGTQVLGFSADSDVSVYPDRDHVALFAQQLARPALVATSSTTFTATSVTSADFAAAILAGKVKRGMLIDTDETPKKTGVINAALGNTISVSAWYVVDGSRNTATPASGTKVNVNPSTKVWALNANVEIKADSMATGAVGFELGLVNEKVDGLGYLYDAVNLGPKKGGTAFQSRGAWIEGFHAFAGTQFGFIASNSTSIGFYAQGGPVGVQSDGATAIAYLAKNAANALVVQDATNQNQTILGGSGAWQRFKGQYAVFTSGQTIDDAVVVASASVVTAATTINLPNPSGNNGQRILYVKNPRSSTASVNFAGATEDVSGGVLVAPAGAVTLISDGSKWIPIGKY